MTSGEVPVILSVSIVVYQPQESILRPCLETLSEALLAVADAFAQPVSVMLIDNSPVPCFHGWLRECAEKNFLKERSVLFSQKHLPHNPGYGAGHNEALLTTQATYHLVLNPDIYMPRDTLVHLLHFMETHCDVGLCAPAVFGLEGERQYLCKRHPTLFDAFLRAFSPRWLKALFHAYMTAYECRDLDYEKTMWNVPFMTGCFMFFRTINVQSIKGFDERFFMYYDDADISRRLLSVARTAYVPTVRVTHRWARETYRSFRMRAVTIVSAFKYWKKWGGFFFRKRQEIGNE
jgi:GT2 family glycosyltransferase